ncbi:MULTISPECIES: sialic acid TRAP transporter substrate-binding protein SiaP [unclassified Bosea (in: a-proteobacteria)]|uniref:sialic acid TRAP transporter substrate-binding protein SiaP n=1 Tax=unclassified Bosea (in: a-proteobacteria) TaxID=2653178 RepID=UPI000F74E4E1|nr:MULTISPECIES: sialic acid TRAP transporter substrate-binding protein SiaP [unclassified Bosea (in: a-proteobacteria)]AZO80105.1 TRAP dicarboxylate transporter subunit DctP [Bosea sp. Tri-49]RXT22892.1 TRAP dicarboxylate transporter subunit DctP [Bosea sp. Tri-39]RXT38361.1 TRAP dicarboxylate transporter subunit DctP [Bosea sp. Tri-54]
MTKLTKRAFLAGSAAAGTAIAMPSVLRAQAIVMRWGDGQPVTHPSPQAALRAAAEIKEKTGGRIEIQSFPGGQLGSSRDMVESVASGALTMVTEGAAQLGQFVPQLSIIEAPYIWRDPAHMTRALSSPLMEELNKALIEKRGMRVIGVNYYGVRHITSGKKEIRSAEDMKGFKLRVPEVDTFKAMAEAWGAKPTPLNFSELYLALSQGAVDGQENPLPTIASAKLGEVQKYLILSAHIITPRLVIVNEAAWKKLSVADQAAMKAAVDASAAWQDKEIITQENGLADTLGKAGMTVITPDLESFRKPVLATLPAKFESKWGKGLWDRIQGL